MKEFFAILGAGLVSSLLGAIFGAIIGSQVPEFVALLWPRAEIRSPVQVATVLGAINGLFLGAGAMAIGLLISALRVRFSHEEKRS